MKPVICAFLYTSVFLFLAGCSHAQQEKPNPRKISVLFDTDANNELDDQHALAYLLFSHDHFNVEGITVNATRNGGNIDSQYAEARRVMTLCGIGERVPLLKGANGSFEQLADSLENPGFDGSAAVDFIIRQAHLHQKEPLVLIAVGKLTNVALAVKKDSSIVRNIRLVWLGSNYPEPGEYNLENDIPGMNFLLKTSIPFEMVVVRYGKPSGTDAVRITREEALKKMPGLGPKIPVPVTGRHGGSFSCFGDYSVSLFKNITYYGDPPARALFDMAAVAIVKNPAWAQIKTIPAPVMINDQWVEQPANSRKIIIWENFLKEAIMADFFKTLQIH